MLELRPTIHEDNDRVEYDDDEHCATQQVINDFALLQAEKLTREARGEHSDDQHGELVEDLESVLEWLFKRLDCVQVDQHHLALNDVQDDLDTRELDKEHGGQDEGNSSDNEDQVVVHGRIIVLPQPIEERHEGFVLPFELLQILLDRLSSFINLHCACRPNSLQHVLTELFRFQGCQVHSHHSLQLFNLFLTFPSGELAENVLLLSFRPVQNRGIF